ncbi:MAG: hypothetical protein RLZZ480_62 [Candidatus Parcubacteria bacterium]|jgi:uncharacterized protein (TIGR00645 family)
MDKALISLGRFMFALRSLMSVFYLGLILVIVGVLAKFCIEVFHLAEIMTVGEIPKTDLIIKVLELVDMTMVAQLVWVVSLAGFSLFVSSGHFDAVQGKPDWLDHVDTYNLKLKLAFAIISISGVHALKSYLKGGMSMEDIFTVSAIHLMFVFAAIGIAIAMKLSKHEVKVCAREEQSSHTGPTNQDSEDAPH